MTDREKLAEIVKSAGYRCLPSNTTDFHLERFVTDLLSFGSTFTASIVEVADSEYIKRIHAHWIINGDWAECSNCHESSKVAVLEHKDFCGACGAAMDEESVVIHP